jgi:hypothetical protein
MEDELATPKGKVGQEDISFISIFFTFHQIFFQNEFSIHVT